MALGPEPPGRLHRGQEQRHPHRAQERDPAQHRPGRIPARLGEHDGLRLGPQRPQHIELAVEGLGPEPGPAIRELREPPGTLQGLIDLRAPGRDGAGAEQRLEAEHHPRCVLDQVPVRAGELLQRGALGAAVIDRPQPAASEQLGELVGIDLIPLVPPSGLPPPVAHEDPSDERGEQIVQPLRLGPFLQGDVHGTAHPAEELDDRRLGRRHNGPRDHPPAFLPHRSHGGCLVHIQRDILRRSLPESPSLLWSTGLGRLHGSSKGRA
ncbi:MAG: hypothetical protein AAB409_06650, partial [Gemmatimonadota bacterium]